MKLKLLVLICSAFALIASSAVPARADLNSKQARTLITKAAGMSLPSSAVQIGHIEMSGANSAEAVADVDLVFGLTRKQSGWRITELRVARNRWEDLSLIARAVGTEVPAGSCDANRVSRETSGISLKRARCLVAELFGI